MLASKSGYGLTVNTSGCLLTQLQQLGATEFFELMTQLIKDGKIEMVNSAMDHPLLPITASDSVDRQIKANTQTLKQLLGVSATTGFFPPELAVDAKTLNSLPCEYVVVDETAVGTQSPIVQYGTKYLVVNNRAIGEIFRSYPTRLQAETVIAMLHQDLTVSANDAELFGHHYAERLQVLADLLDSDKIRFVTVTEAIKILGNLVPVMTEIKPSTWQNCKGFDLWVRNDLQRKYLKLLAHVHELDYDRDLFDLATSSCYLYWLSNWPWWHPGLVVKGAENLIRSVKDPKAEKVYQDFIKRMWGYHNSGKVEKNYLKYEEVRKLDNYYN